MAVEVEVVGDLDPGLKRLPSVHHHYLHPSNRHLAPVAHHLLLLFLFPLLLLLGEAL